MRNYNVYWYGLRGKMITNVSAENKNKATYKVFKSLLGIELTKECKFICFLNYYYLKTVEVEGGNQSHN